MSVNTTAPTATKLESATAYFPMAAPRPAQTEALEFITDAVAKGYPDIVISAPTGVGKSGIGASAALWAGSFDLLGYERGGYYLVGQKLLQDQLENDFPRFVTRFRTSAASLKSASTYPCRSYATCMMGSLASKKGTLAKCPQRVDKSCPYLNARWQFSMSKVAVTNYPYLFTEHTHVGDLNPRNILIADECHLLEQQIINFIEVAVNRESLDMWAPGCRPVPKLNYVEDFADWLKERYAVLCRERLSMLSENLAATGHTNRKMQDEYNALTTHVNRLEYAAEYMLFKPESWVFWQEMVDDEWQCTAKPISAAPFLPSLIQEMGSTRIYMSAYPGPKDVFCRNLGLNTQAVAWLELDSNFPLDNRPIHMTTVGSMSRQWIDQTTPKLLKMCETILEAHPTEKGIIHCHSYQLGRRIYDYFRATSMGQRVLFATKASERLANFNLHRRSTAPTVMLSPSITEGFSFDDDLARFQIVAKVPFPYLGDRQVAAKMKLDQDWYTLQTAQTVIQACGRIVRSDTDHGSTYILDSDFLRLYSENTKFFPKWFRDAFKFY